MIILLAALAPTVAEAHLTEGSSSSPSAIDSLTIDAGQNQPTIGKAVLQAGTQYTLVVSGTMSKTSSKGGYTFDSLYCIVSTVTSYGCDLGNPPKRVRAPAIEVGTDTAHLGTIDAFVNPGSSPTCGTSCYPDATGGAPVAYESDHLYKVSFYPSKSGPLEVGTRDAFSHTANVPGGGQFDSGSITVAVYAGVHAPVSHRSSQELLVVATSADNGGGECQWRKVGSPAGAWLPLEHATVIKAGDYLSCEPGGSVTLRTPDGETYTLSDFLLVNVASFFEEGGFFHAELTLKFGEIAAQVNKSEATKSDFRIKSPTATVSVRGTIFTTLYDPSSGATIESTSRGVVEVTPTNTKLAPVSVGVGHEVAVTATRIGPVTQTGGADARGGIGLKEAYEDVAQRLAARIKPCQVELDRASDAIVITPSTDGWQVAVKVTGGEHGTSMWTVSKNTVTPTNALARTIAAGCPSSPSATPPNLSGSWVNKAARTAPSWKLTTNASLTSLDATWTGGPGHTSLRGSFHGALQAHGSSLSYVGTFSITEGSLHLVGSAKFAIDSADQIEITIEPSSGTASSYTFVRTNS
jgi:hypothetical protein